MIKVIAMRHGEAKHNLEDKLTSSDSPKWTLTRKGQSEVKLASTHLKKEQIDFIISSPLPRAVQTAQIIAQTLEFPLKDIQIDTRLKEPFFGDLEDKTYAEFFSLFSSHHEAFAAGAPHGETGEDIAKRVRSLLTEIVSNLAFSDKTVLLVTHGFILCHIQKFFSGTFNEIPSYAGWIRFKCSQ